VHIKIFSNEFLGCLLAGFEVYSPHSENECGNKLSN